MNVTGKICGLIRKSDDKNEMTRWNEAVKIISVRKKKSLSDSTA